MAAVIVEGEWAVLGRPIVSNGDFVAWLCESDALFPNYFGEDLFSLFLFLPQCGMSILSDYERIMGVNISHFAVPYKTVSW